MGGVTGVHPTFIEKPGVGGFVFGKDEGALGGLENEFVELGELVEGGEAKVAGFLVNADGVPLVNTFYGNVGGDCQRMGEPVPVWRVKRRFS